MRKRARCGDGGNTGDGGRTGESPRILVELEDGVALRRKVWHPANGGRVGGLTWKVVVVGVGLRRKVC